MLLQSLVNMHRLQVSAGLKPSPLVYLLNSNAQCRPNITTADMDTFQNGYGLPQNLLYLGPSKVIISLPSLGLDTTHEALNQPHEVSNKGKHHFQTSSRFDEYAISLRAHEATALSWFTIQLYSFLGLLGSELVVSAVPSLSFQ